MRKNLLRVAAIVAVVLGLVVLVLEIGLRFMPGKVDELRPELAKIIDEAPMEANPYLAYAGKPNFTSAPDAEIQKSHNSWGFRGPSIAPDKPEGVYRIVCLGGSSTYGHTPTSDEKTWPGRLEYYLNREPVRAQCGQEVQVLNAGLSGYSTFESTVNLAFRMVEWEPDLVIVYHTINDMRCALYLHGGPVAMDNRHWRAVWPRVVEAPAEKLLENSMTYLVLRKLFTNYTDGVDALNTWAIVGYDPKAKDLYERGQPAELGFENFERNLRTIQAIAKEFGARVIFATQACDERDIKARSGPNQVAGMARMTEIIARVAGERDVILVDAKKELEEQARSAGIDRYFTAEVHLTDEGADYLAQIFARAIAAGGHGLLD